MIEVRPYRGVGRQLLQCCEQLAREAGQADFRITVLAENTRARSLYQKSGFRDILVTMRKSLAEP